MYQVSPLMHFLLNCFRWLPIKQIRYFSEMYVILLRVTTQNLRNQNSPRFIQE